MSELEIKKSQALSAISRILNTTPDKESVALNQVNVLALGIVDLLVEHGATIGIHILSRGKGLPAIRQKFYEIKTGDLRAAVGHMVEEIVLPEDTTIDQELPSYLFDGEGDEA